MGLKIAIPFEYQTVIKISLKAMPFIPKGEQAGFSAFTRQPAGQG